MTLVVVGVLWSGARLLLQLRDFDAHIADPGQWGFFGGHVEGNENPETGLRRELVEEIGWNAMELQPLGRFPAADGKHLIIGYRGQVDASLGALVLGEGQEIGVFSPTELGTGYAYSHRWRRSFPLTAITRQGLQLWC